MAKIGVCIETLFGEDDYAVRIEKIATLGYKSYEFWFHDKRFDGKNIIDEPKDLDAFAELNAKHGLTCTDFVLNHPFGGIVASLIDKADRSRILDGLEAMIERAQKIGCRKLISGSGDVVEGISREQAIESMTETLSEAGAVCAKHGITLILEPFNSRVDHPDVFLDDPYTSVDVIKAVDNRNVRLLFDIYHMQIMAGNITDFVRENIEYIAHFHIAGVPGRNEPQNSELNYPFMLAEIDRLGFDGYFGLEYWPTMDHAESLRRTKEYLGA